MASDEWRKQLNPDFAVTAAREGSGSPPSVGSKRSSVQRSAVQS